MSTDSEPRKKAVPKYFKKTPDKPEYGGAIALMVFGGLAFLIGLLSSGGGDASGGIICGFLAGGGLALMGVISYSNKSSKYRNEYEKAEPKPTDAQMDEWLAEDLARTKREAMTRLDLVPEQILGNPEDPITIVGPASEAKWAVGKDDIIRFSMHDILVVYLTDYHLAAYKCKLNFVSGMLDSESTQEYHYTDVVSVATQAASSGLAAIMLDGTKKEIASYQKFALSVASGERIEVAISFPQLSDIIEKGRLAPTGADQAMSTIRAMLREKKGGTQA
jgi:hypothetical protein